LAPASNATSRLPGMKLFMVYVGGSMTGANTELHDVRFSIRETIEDCYDDLRRQ
jgi:hypothetical protein